MSKTLSEEIFYHEAADTTVRLKDGKILKFNKAALCITSGNIILYELFLGKLREPDITDFIDIDHDTFKLFLDCIMGFQPYTFDNADQIFPVAWKYQIENVIDQCVEALTPSKMSERIAELLNLALFYRCEKLEYTITRFIDYCYSPYKLLEKEAYCHSLEPDSMKLILSTPNKMIIDSSVLMALKKWADNYMKNNTVLESVTSFLKKHDLLQFFKLEYFETTSAISEFCLSESGKNIFPVDEILAHLQNSNDLSHGKSKWEKIKKDCIITEEIICQTMQNSNYSNYNVRVNIERSKIVAYGHILTTGEGSCAINLIGQDSAGNQLFEINQEEFSFEYGSGDRPEDNRNHFISCNLRSNISNRQLTRCTLKITWTFLRTCRVLLMNRPGDKLNGSEKMYFTRNVSASF